MKYKTVDGHEYPVPNAKVDAFVNLRMSQRFHSNNKDFPEFIEDEQVLARIRKELELCEILLPESTNVIGWLISSQGFDTVSRLYQRALDECDEHNIAGVPKPADQHPDGLSEDGLTLRWGGRLFPIKPTAARVIGQLVDSFNHGFPYLAEEYLKTVGETETDMRHLVRDGGLADVVIREVGPNGKSIKGKWGLIDPKKLSTVQQIHT